MAKSRRRYLLTSCLLGVVLTGCVRDEITHYSTERRPREAPYRLVAAVIPVANQTWFVRMQGPTEQMKQSVSQFDTFVKSIRPVDDEANPLQWNKPTEWVESDEKMVRGFRRHAAFRVAKDADALEVVVTSLGGMGGSILPNVNRYRGQLGLPQIGAAELPTCTTRFMLGDIEVTRIDLQGKKPVPRSGGPFQSMGPSS